MKSEIGTYYMPAGQLANLVGHQVRGLRPSLDWDEGSSSFSILDCFEQNLRRSRRLMFVVGGEVELLTAEGEAIRQIATPKARFVADFEDGPVKDAIADLSPLRAFLKVAAGTIRTGRLIFLDDEGKTQARAVLRLLEPEEGNPVVLVSPQGLRGYDQALDDLTARIRASGGAPLMTGNIYRMIDHSRSDYVPKPTVEVGRDETAFDAASSLISSYLPVARANEDGIVDDIDTEFLHDYRIALRKIRSVLSLFKGVYDAEQTIELKTRFSALMVPTGPLRDLDVYLLEQKEFYDLVPATMRGGLDAMFALLRNRREAEHNRLSDHLQTRRYEKEMKALAKLFAKKKKLLPGANSSRASYDLACELIWKRYRKIRRIASSLDASTPDEEVHALRIECKKLRYLMEFFGPVFAGDTFAELLKPLKRLQDSLGLFNDYAVQQANLQALVDALGEEPQRLEIAKSVGALIAVLYQRQVAMRERIVEAFGRFNSDNTQRSFRALFHDGRNV